MKLDIDKFFDNNSITHIEGNPYFDKTKINSINRIGSGGGANVYNIEYKSNLPIDEDRECYRGDYNVVAFKILKDKDTRVEETQKELDKVNKLKKRLMDSNISLHSDRIDDNIQTIFTQDISDNLLGNAKCNGFLIDYKIDDTNPHVLIFDKINLIDKRASAIKGKIKDKYFVKYNTDVSDPDPRVVVSEKEKMEDLSEVLNFYFSEINRRNLFNILSKLHSVGCYHCDIKPGNICITFHNNSNQRNNNISKFKIIDFNDVYFYEDIIKNKKIREDILGFKGFTPHYFSPFIFFQNSSIPGNIINGLIANDLWAMVLTNIEFALADLQIISWNRLTIYNPPSNLTWKTNDIQLKLLYKDADKYIERDRLKPPYRDIVVGLFNRLFKVCETETEAREYTAQQFIEHIKGIFTGYTYSYQTLPNILTKEDWLKQQQEQRLSIGFLNDKEIEQGYNRYLENQPEIWGGMKKYKKKKRTKKYKKKIKKYKVKKSKKHKKSKNSKRKTCRKR